MCHTAKCYKEADHFWPLDKAPKDHTVFDLKGSKHGKSVGHHTKDGVGNEGLSTNVMKIDATENWTIDFGDFSENCISDFALCTNGITVAFWVYVVDGEDSDILYTAEKDADRGLTIFYLTATSQLTVNMYSTNKYGSLSVKITPRIWYHIFVAWREKPDTNLWMVINGADLVWGTVHAASRLQESHSHLLVGLRPTGGTSNFRIGQLAIWRKALGVEEMQTVFNCVGLRPCKFDGYCSY